MNDLGRFGLSATAVVRRGSRNRSTKAWSSCATTGTKPTTAPARSDPNTADPYECVAYDLRLLAEETDPDPRHTGGLVRHRTNYALAGFDYLTFAA